MIRSDLGVFYQKRKTDFETTLEKTQTEINLISNLRILVAALFLVAIYFTFSNFTFLLGAVPLLIVFVLLISKHNALYEQKIHLENLVKINHLEVQALSGNISGFQAGTDFIDPHHPYTHDLDIFGEGSLFQAISRGNTIDGKYLMAQRLSHPMTSSADIGLHQEAIRELTPKTDFRQHFQASGMEIDELRYDRDQLLEWVHLPSFVFGSSRNRILLTLLPILTITAVIAAFFLSVAKPVAIVLALSQWVILGMYSKKVSHFHEYISRKKNILEKYGRLLHVFGKEKFTAEILKKLTSRADEADLKVKSLASLVSYLNARLNFLTNLVVNSLLLYDLQCVYRLEKWKHENAVHLTSWLNVISEAEVLCSMGTFAFNHPSFIYPEINSELTIKAEGLGHPLISEKECITNNLYMGKGQAVLIITGANMAGKSTFLRTSGVNLVLALAGAPVYAKAFSCPIINLRSGMRTADSLKDHQSYFYAELDRLKTIMDELRSDKPLLILLDEILKGTNSTDKQSGSIALVKQLLPHPCLAMIATHDIVLGDLENQFPQHIKNYHFEANIENDQLSFDYKLKPGIAQTMNATFLMKKMGIIPRV
jgi:DNA mismatch repair ATPase MutS